MAPELHLHPGRLRSRAAVSAGLSEELRAVLPGVVEVRAGPVLAEEQERLCAAVRHAVRELAELSAALAAAAAAAETADDDTARALRRAGERR
jgi:uncharacterized protein YukE